MALTQIQNRRDPSLIWTTVNPILAAGELGIETDTYKAKVGDGVTRWKSLPYLRGTASGEDGFTVDWSEIIGTIASNTALTTALNNKQNTAQKGVANGYAPLGADGKVPSSHLPAFPEVPEVPTATTTTPGIARQATDAEAAAGSNNTAFMTPKLTHGLLAGAPQDAPVGSHLWHYGTTAPDGYLIADGAALSRSVYAELFAVIGTTYGTGNGSTTFNLPDLRDEFVRGKGTSRAVGNKQGDAARRQIHIYSYLSGSSESIGKRVIFYGSGAGGSAGSGMMKVGPITGFTTTANSGTYSPRGPSVDIIDYVARDNLPVDTENRPQNITLLPCIKY